MGIVCGKPRGGKLQVGAIDAVFGKIRNTSLKTQILDVVFPDLVTHAGADGGSQMEILESVTSKPADEVEHKTLDRFKGILQLENLAEVMKDTSLCGLGQNAPNPVISTLKYLRDEYEEHIFDRRCPSNTCTELRSWYIDVELCTGCSICARRCPAEAIIGTARHPYFIVQEKCIGCGICFDVCKFTAVYYK